MDFFYNFKTQKGNDNKFCISLMLIYFFLWYVNKQALWSVEKELKLLLVGITVFRINFSCEKIYIKWQCGGVEKEQYRISRKL